MHGRGDIEIHLGLEIVHVPEEDGALLVNAANPRQNAKGVVQLVEALQRVVVDARVADEIVQAIWKEFLRGLGSAVDTVRLGDVQAHEVKLPVSVLCLELLETAGLVRVSGSGDDDVVGVFELFVTPISYMDKGRPGCQSGGRATPYQFRHEA